MRATILPGASLHGPIRVPGDKSISHRWLILASTAQGSSRLAGLPPSLDVRTTASCLAKVARIGGPSLEAWVQESAKKAQGHGFTWDSRDAQSEWTPLEVQGEGRSALTEPPDDLDCANSGTSMRLLAGVLASTAFTSTLRGDASLQGRPMERVAEPLRAMGAHVTTTDGHAPVRVRGGDLRAIRFEPAVPSAQVKSAVLLAGLAASGETIVVEPTRTRDHTERALSALGAPIRALDEAIAVRAFQHDGFQASVPGDVSSAAFLVAAAALTRSELRIEGVGLNPSRTAFLDVMRRMGVSVRASVETQHLGEPVGELDVTLGEDLSGTEVPREEIPLILDEVPMLALVAAHATGESRFAGAGELTVKESDRLRGLAEGILGLGGRAKVEGEDLLVAGGGLDGGLAHATGDHRMAMAFAVAGLASRGPIEVHGIESADVSFPGFVSTLLRLGARVEG